MKLSELIERMQRNIKIWGDPDITLEKLVRIYRIETGEHQEGWHADRIIAVRKRGMITEDEAVKLFAENCLR